MFEYHQNTLCVSGKWMTDSGVVSVHQYDKLFIRKQAKKIIGGGNGRQAWVAFDSIKTEIRNKIIEVVGYNPHEKVSEVVFLDYIENDPKAMEFYQNYTLDNGKALPEKAVMEYHANVCVCNAMRYILNHKLAQRKALSTTTRSKNELWENIARAVENLPRHTHPHSLPANTRRLKDKFNQYLNDGYEVFIHKNFASKNAEKLSDVAKSYILARWQDNYNRVATYTQLLHEYNKQATLEGWKPLKSEQTLINFLTDPKIETLWYAHRFGELRFSQKFMYQHKTLMPTMRDSLWYSDGTKLNLFYQEEGTIKTINVYEVMDAFSEVFLGYFISEKEDFVAQFNAYKMAVKIAGVRPYQITYDNQSGHKKLQNGNFLNKLARLAIRTQPYNGKSKTIESAFGRFQAQFLAQEWNFTGQNITAKKTSSKANMEYILANKQSLPTLQDLKKQYEQKRTEWNQAPHPKTGKPRIDMYLESINPETHPLNMFEMADLFWIEREKPITCTASGISFREKNIQYDYVVFAGTEIDFEWMMTNVNKKFVVRYDPDDMSQIFLYEKMPLGLRFVTAADTKPVIHRGKQEQEHFEAAFIRKAQDKIKELRVQTRDIADANLAKHNRSAQDYQMNTPAIKGLETQKNINKDRKPVDIGQIQKQESEMVAVDIYDKI